MTRTPNPGLESEGRKEAYEFTVTGPGMRVQIRLERQEPIQWELIQRVLDKILRELDASSGEAELGPDVTRLARGVPEHSAPPARCTASKP
jgi:hypothetical protein